MEEQQDAMVDRWLLEVRSRSDDVKREIRSLTRDFLLLLTSILPMGLGAFRGEAEAILQQAAELYGNLAAHRGLAAGEAVEEVQLLRGVLFRFLYAGPAQGGSIGLDLRELLQLNRLIDMAVTYASVGHTDALFFSLFHGAGVSGSPSPDLLVEVREQVAGIRDEVSTLRKRESEKG